MESYTRDVASVAFKGEYGSWIGGLDIVEFDCVAASGGEEPLVGRDTETIDLGVWMRDSSGAYATQSFPESKRRPVISKE